MSTQHLCHCHHRCWVDIGSIPPFLCPLLYLEQIFLPSLVVAKCIVFQHFKHSGNKNTLWILFADMLYICLNEVVNCNRIAI